MFRVSVECRERARNRQLIRDTYILLSKQTGATPEERAYYLKMAERENRLAKRSFTMAAVFPIALALEVGGIIYILKHISALRS